MITHDNDIPQYQEQSIIISTAMETPIHPKTSLIALIFDQESTKQKKLAETISEHLKTVDAYDCVLTSLEGLEHTQSPFERVCILLYEFERPFFRDIDVQSYEHLQKVIEVLNSAIWVTMKERDAAMRPEYAEAVGFGRTLRSEKPHLKFVTVAVEIDHSSVEENTEMIVNMLNNKIRSDVDDTESEYQQRGRLPFLPRVVEANKLNKMVSTKLAPYEQAFKTIGQMPTLELSIETPGILESLIWVGAKDDAMPLRADEVQIRTEAAGINFRDCLIATGQVNSTEMGIESSGVIVPTGSRVKDFSVGDSVGDRVAAMGTNMFKSNIRCSTSQIFKLPDDLSFNDACSLPTVACTVIHSLMNIARLQKGESILIHAGAGATGQTAVQIAQYLGAEVYTTVGSIAKKEALKDMYKLDDDHIFSS